MTIQTPIQQSLFQPHKGGWMLNYNEQIVEVVNPDTGKNETLYAYDQVWVSAKTKEEIVIAIIRTKYSVNDELKLNRLTKTTSEWLEYDAFADAAIAIANEVLSV